MCCPQRPELLTPSRHSFERELFLQRVRLWRLVYSVLTNILHDPSLIYGDLTYNSQNLSELSLSQWP
jgi:hypothetical protein